MKKQNKRILSKRILALLIDTAILAIISAGIYAAVFFAGLEMLVFYISSGALALLYPIFFELLPSAATPGMLLLRIHIGFNNTKMHFLSLLSRALFRLIFCIPLGVGFWCAFFDSEKKTFYDRLSSTFIAETAPLHHGKTPCLIRHKKDGQKEIYPIGYDRVVIGRNPTVCNIVYSNEEVGVSRAHCSVVYNRQVNLFLLEDLGSSYGTFLDDDKRLPSGKVFALSAGTNFYVATNYNLFTVEFAENVK